MKFTHFLLSAFLGATVSAADTTPSSSLRGSIRSTNNQRHHRGLEFTDPQRKDRTGNSGTTSNSNENNSSNADVTFDPNALTTRQQQICGATGAVCQSSPDCCDDLACNPFTNICENDDSGRGHVSSGLGGAGNSDISNENNSSNVDVTFDPNALIIGQEVCGATGAVCQSSANCCDDLSCNPFTTTCQNDDSGREHASSGLGGAGNSGINVDANTNTIIGQPRVCGAMDAVCQSSVDCCDNLRCNLFTNTCNNNPDVEHIRNSDSSSSKTADIANDTP